MIDRKEHQGEVNDFLHKHLSIYDWRFSIPNGSGNESYFVRGFKRKYYVKIGVDVNRYLAMAEVGLTPPIILHGRLESGLSIMVQLFVPGRNPSRSDYQKNLIRVAQLLREMHTDSRIRNALQVTSSNCYKDTGLLALNRLRQKWERYKSQVPQVAVFVDNSLEYLSEQINLFSGEGLVASHGDICNANWLFATDGKIYLLDFESLRMDDPALDLGALLWWYYPPEWRQQFLDIAGYPYDDELKFRMCIRMAMHCLDITLPREQSFDQFDSNHYEEALRDFKAILKGTENPEGYQ